MAKAKGQAKSKIVGVLYLLGVLLILAFLFINDKGIIKYLEVKERVDNLQNEIDSSEQRITEIEKEMDSLKTDRYKQEKTAREKYNMKRPREKGLNIKTK